MFTTQENGDYAFSNARRTVYGTIDCDVTIEETGEVIPFSASPDDTEEYGRVLYNQLNTTYLSQVTDITQEELDEYAASKVRKKRNKILVKTDWTQNADVPQATRDLWAPYRQALRDVPGQTGFPYEITWPTPPA